MLSAFDTSLFLRVCLFRRFFLRPKQPTVTKKKREKKEKTTLFPAVRYWAARLFCVYTVFLYSWYIIHYAAIYYNIYAHIECYMYLTARFSLSEILFFSLIYHDIVFFKIVTAVRHTYPGRLKNIYLGTYLIFLWGGLKKLYCLHLKLVPILQW